jgi:hypothetical protein
MTQNSRLTTHRCFIGGDTLDVLPLPSQVGHTKVGGVSCRIAERFPELEG